MARSLFWAAADGEHVFAIMVQLDVMATAQPANVQGFAVSVMMGVNL